MSPFFICIKVNAYSLITFTVVVVAPEITLII